MDFGIDDLSQRPKLKVKVTVICSGKKAGSDREVHDLKSYIVNDNDANIYILHNSLPPLCPIGQGMRDQVLFKFKQKQSTNAAKGE